MWNDIYGLAFVESNVGRVGSESDAKGGIQANTSCLNNCSRLRVVQASSVSCNSLVMLRIEFPPHTCCSPVNKSLFYIQCS